jgi:pyruvate-formate lyase-activating enzyme
MMGVADCALPVAAPANERPPEPVSIRGDVDASPTEAAAFHPTADEIAAVAVRHLANGGSMVSFGRACEGEPLLAARLLETAIEAIRSRTASGTLHLETNGSSPAALRRLIVAGLDSVAVRLASARAETYERLHGPQGYRFGDVRASIDVAMRSNAAVSLVLLVMPGLTDRGRELDAILDLAADLPPGSQILLRDLACDPRRTVGLLRTEETPSGIATALDRIRAAAPKLRIGALVRPLARV